MVKSPFTWLGTGRAQKRGVARHGVLLDKVARRGLPVPQGAILLDDLFRIYLHEGIVELIGDLVAVPDPQWLLDVLYRDVRFPRLRKTADLIAIPPDGYEGPLPPVAIAQMVDLEDAVQLAAALGKVWSYPTTNEAIRRDVLLVSNVAANKRGTAIVVGEGREDQVITIPDQGDELDATTLPHLGAWQRPSTGLPPHARRLQMLLRGVRRTLGKDETWEFTWADDGEICWILGFS